MEIIDSSPKFKRCKTIESMENRQRDNPDLICCTTAGTNALQFKKGATFKIGADPGKYIGLNILSGTISELSHWRKFGVSDEKMWRILYDLKTRIKTRFQSHYYARSYVDSSPFSLNSRVDRYIWGDAEKDPQNLVVRSAMWEAKTWEFEDLKDTFPVYKGSENSPPKVLNDISEISKYSSTDIINVPKRMKDGTDLKDTFERDTENSLRDLAGIPSGNGDKLISNLSIIDNMFDDNLQNVYTGIYAPANKMPERLIWDQIVDKFFVKTADNRYEFYRASSELRWLGIDQSFSGDCLGLSMCHQEVNEKGVNIIVFDFTITIIPTKYKINLQAIYEFILDLSRLGRVKFGGIHFDRFESETTIQNLERKEFPVFKTSVDISKDPYNLFVSYLQNNRIKAGKSIFLKNNLKSLEETTLKTKTKIDHSKGKTEYSGDDDWKTSVIGLNSKDCSDSACNSFYQCCMNFKGVPKYQYIEYTNQKSMTDNVMKFLNDKYSYK
jgi:hypothetical protein